MRLSPRYQYGKCRIIFKSWFNTESILNNFKIIRLINEIIDDITDLNDYTVKFIKQLNMKTGKTDKEH